MGVMNDLSLSQILVAVAVIWAGLWMIGQTRKRKR
jgi:hypothetical protein